MSCEVAALPFQAHAIYGTWSIEFKKISISFSFNSLNKDRGDLVYQKA